jgi:hypothetical protein
LKNKTLATLSLAAMVSAAWTGAVASSITDTANFALVKEAEQTFTPIDTVYNEIATSFDTSGACVTDHLYELSSNNPSVERISNQQCCAFVLFAVNNQTPRPLQNKYITACPSYNTQGALDYALILYKTNIDPLGARGFKNTLQEGQTVPLFSNTDFYRVTFSNKPFTLDGV